MKLMQLRYFSAVCHLGGVTRAAERLHVSQPAITAAIQNLEDALGHEKYFQTKCSETANQIQDADLKSCVQQMAQKHQQIFQSF